MTALLTGTYTVVNPKTGGYRTVRIVSDTSWMTSPPPTGTRIAQLLIGPDNSSSFRGFAFITPDGVAKPWRSAGADAVAALNFLLKRGPGREAEFGKAYAVRSGRCCFCNRKLTTPGSVYFGYGPECATQNSLPWESSPTQILAATLRQADAAASVIAEVSSVAAAQAARVGWQEFRPNPVTIHNADGTLTSTAAARYAQLFPND